MALSSAVGFPNSVAFKTSSAIFPVFPSVFRSKFMPSLAVGFSGIFSAVCRAAQSKPRYINLLFWMQNFFDRPSKAKSLVYCLVSNTKFVCPFHGRLSFPVVLNKSINAPIALLRSTTNPTTVFRRIVPIYVYSINGHVFWRMTHILQKTFKAINPSVAYFYAPAAIVFKSWIVWIKASLFNSVPYGLYPCSVKPVCFSHSVHPFLGDCAIQQHRSQS